MRGRTRWGGLLSALLLALGGCAGAAGPEAPPSPAAAGFTNPVFESNFPDPMVVAAGGAYWAFGTNGNGANVQTLSSPDLVDWRQADDALPELPDWTQPGKVWAPEATRAGSTYVLYYTTTDSDDNVQCLSVAVARRVAGPYADRSRRPLICQPDQGGSIDASAFTAADGKRYLYWKNDGNSLGADTYLYVQRLDDAGTGLVGRPRRLFKQDLDWEGPLVEAPFVWEQAGRFHLFYSANRFDSFAYAVGHAVADSPLGPFTKSPGPVLSSNDVAAGPGHCALIRRNGRVWMLYHAWPPDSVGSEVPGRTLWLSEVSFADDGSVTVTPPTVDYPTRP